MIAHTRQTKIDEIIEMTYPRLISIYGKEGTKGLLSLSFGGLGIKTIYKENPINLKISTITKLKDGYICMGEYDQNMILEFTDERVATGYAQAKIDGYKLEKMASNKVRMSGKSYLLAINDLFTKKTWKYLAYIGEPSATGGKEILSKEIVLESAKLKSVFNK